MANNNQSPTLLIEEGELIQPDSAVATSEFSSSYDIGNAIDGSDLPANFTPSDTHGGYGTNDHWTTRAGGVGAVATFFFNEPVTLDTFHLWNHRSSSYSVTQFDLVFKDVNGETLFSLPNQTAGYSATAQTYGFDSVVGVRSVDFKIDSNNGSTYTGVAEVAFETSDFTILENSPVDTVITTINATDPENDSLTFSISAGNPDINDNGIPAFSIEADTGNLKVNDPEDLNFETQTSFDLAISVSDGQNSDTKVATVYLNDVSNGEPVIDSIDNVSLTPDVVAGDVIVSAVNVTDSNTPIENITFSLSNVPTDATDAPFFSIDSNTGESNGFRL